MNYCAHTLDKIFYTTGLAARSVTALGNNFLTDDSVEATAQLLVEFEGGVNATFCYCGCKVPSDYQTDFYFTNGAAQIRYGCELWISVDGREFEHIDCGDTCHNFMEEQLTEFLKLLIDEPTEVVSPEYGRSVIDVLEKALAQI